MFGIKIQFYLYLAIALLVGAGGMYLKGRFDGSNINKGKQLEKTVNDYETDRKTKSRIGDADFDSVLDLNDRMYRGSK